MPIVTKYVPEKKSILRSWSYEITGFKYKAKLRPPEHTLPKKKASILGAIVQVLNVLFWSFFFFYFGYGIAKAQDIINMKPPAPVERTPIVEPPPSSSTDINLFWKQFIFHNSIRMYNKAKETSPSIKKVEENINEVNNVAGGEAQVNENTKVKTGSELNKGIFYQEFHFKNWMLRNELNALSNDYTGYIQVEGYRVYYKTPLFKNDINYGLTVTTVFD